MAPDPLFRPDPVLSIGIAADDLPGDDASRHAIAAAATVLEALATECRRVVDAHPDLFSSRPFRLRIVSARAGGLDDAIVAMSSSMPASIGSQIALIRRHTEEAGSTRHPAGVVGPDPGELGFAAECDFTARASERLLDQSDILLAVWDGKPDGRPGRAGTLVQDAIGRTKPVILLPVTPAGETDIIDDPDDLLLPPVASELPRVRLGDNLDRVIARAFAPPDAPAELQALRDCLGERAAPRTYRPEYPALLLLASRQEAPDAASTLTAKEEWARANGIADGVSPAAGAIVRRHELRGERLEELAAFYGRRVRSGSVLRYAGPALGALLIGLLAITVPELGLGWLGVQALVMALTVTEATVAARGRWTERWLDYRSLAERLRCDRFLAPLGIGHARLERDTQAEDPAWMRWCHRRLLRETWPEGQASPDVVAAAYRHLADVEIAGQIRYHCGAALRYRSLARRLRLIGTGSILLMLAGTLALFGLTAARQDMGLAKAILMVLLITLPSVFLATRGLRFEGAFELAAARSEQALAALLRLEGQIAALPATYGRLCEASRSAAAAMILDTVDWRVGQQRSRTPYRSPRPAIRTPAR